jgi:hypothetical protein
MAVVKILIREQHMLDDASLILKEKIYIIVLNYDSMFESSFLKIG